MFHRAVGKILDYLLISRSLITSYLGFEIHNELLQGESIGFTDDKLFPESDHALVVAAFEFPDG